MPSMGSVLGHSPTNSLEAQHVKIVDIFPHHKICIQLSKEVQQYFPIVVRGMSKTMCHLSIQWSLMGGKVHHSIEMCLGDIRKVIRLRQSKQVIDVFFCYFQLLYLVVAQPINVLLSFPLPI